MANLVGALQRASSARQSGADAARVGIVVGVEQGRYLVAVGGSSVIATLGVSVALQPGDHVNLAGTPPVVIGLLGRDEGAL